MTSSPPIRSSARLVASTWTPGERLQDPGEGRGGVEHVLEVVEHDQQRPPVQRLLQGGHGGVAGDHLHPERAGHDLGRPGPGREPWSGRRSRPGSRWRRRSGARPPAPAGSCRRHPGPTRVTTWLSSSASSTSAMSWSRPIVSVAGHGTGVRRARTARTVDGVVRRHREGLGPQRLSRRARVVVELAAPDLLHEVELAQRGVAVTGGDVALDQPQVRALVERVGGEHLVPAAGVLEQLEVAQPAALAVLLGPGRRRGPRAAGRPGRAGSPRRRGGVRHPRRRPGRRCRTGRRRR